MRRHTVRAASRITSKNYNKGLKITALLILQCFFITQISWADTNLSQARPVESMAADAVGRVFDMPPIETGLTSAVGTLTATAGRPEARFDRAALNLCGDLARRFEDMSYFDMKVLDLNRPDRDARSVCMLPIGDVMAGLPGAVLVDSNTVIRLVEIYRKNPDWYERIVEGIMRYHETHGHYTHVKGLSAREILHRYYRKVYEQRLGGATSAIPITEIVAALYKECIGTPEGVEYAQMVSELNTAEGIGLDGKNGIGTSDYEARKSLESQANISMMLSDRGLADISVDEALENLTLPFWFKYVFFNTEKYDEWRKSADSADLSQGRYDNSIDEEFFLSIKLRHELPWLSTKAINALIAKIGAFDRRFSRPLSLPGDFAERILDLDEFGARTLGELVRRCDKQELPLQSCRIAFVSGDGVNVHTTLQKGLEKQVQGGYDGTGQAIVTEISEYSGEDEEPLRVLGCSLNVSRRAGRAKVYKDEIKDELDRALRRDILAVASISLERQGGEEDEAYARKVDAALSSVKFAVDFRIARIRYKKPSGLPGQPSMTTHEVRREPGVFEQILTEELGRHLSGLELDSAYGYCKFEKEDEVSREYKIDIPDAILDKIRERICNYYDIPTEYKDEIEIGWSRRLQAKVDGNTYVLRQSGIGHNRWGTGGSPSKVNSHPFSARNKRLGFEVALVHNGNFFGHSTVEKVLQSWFKDELEWPKQGKTDSETFTRLVALMASRKNGEAAINLDDAVGRALRLSFALDDLRCLRAMIESAGGSFSENQLHYIVKDLYDEYFSKLISADTIAEVQSGSVEDFKDVSEVVSKLGSIQEALIYEAIKRPHLFDPSSYIDLNNLIENAIVDHVSKEVATDMKNRFFSGGSMSQFAVAAVSNQSRDVVVRKGRQGGGVVVATKDLSGTTVGASETHAFDMDRKEPHDNPDMARYNLGLVEVRALEELRGVNISAGKDPQFIDLLSGREESVSGKKRPIDLRNMTMELATWFEQEIFLQRETWFRTLSFLVGDDGLPTLTSLSVQDNALARVGDWLLVGTGTSDTTNESFARTIQQKMDSVNISTCRSFEAGQDPNALPQFRNYLQTYKKKGARRLMITCVSQGGETEEVKQFQEEIKKVNDHIIENETASMRGEIISFLVDRILDDLRRDAEIARKPENNELIREITDFQARENRDNPPSMVELMNFMLKVCHNPDVTKPAKIETGTIFRRVEEKAEPYLIILTAVTNTPGSTVDENSATYTIDKEGNVVRRSNSVYPLNTFEHSVGATGTATGNWLALSQIAFKLSLANGDMTEGQVKSYNEDFHDAAEQLAEKLFIKEGDRVVMSPDILNAVQGVVEAAFAPRGRNTVLTNPQIWYMGSGNFETIGREGRIKGNEVLRMDIGNFDLTAGSHGAWPALRKDGTCVLIIFCPGGDVKQFETAIKKLEEGNTRREEYGLVVAVTDEDIGFIDPRIQENADIVIALPMMNHDLIQTLMGFIFSHIFTMQAAYYKYEKVGEALADIDNLLTAIRADDITLTETVSSDVPQEEKWIGSKNDALALFGKTLVPDEQRCKRVAGNIISYFARLRYLGNFSGDDEIVGIIRNAQMEKQGQKPLLPAALTLLDELERTGRVDASVIELHRSALQDEVNSFKRAEEVRRIMQERVRMADAADFMGEYAQMFVDDDDGLLEQVNAHFSEYLQRLPAEDERSPQDSAFSKFVGLFFTHTNILKGIREDTSKSEDEKDRERAELLERFRSELLGNELLAGLTSRFIDVVEEYRLEPQDRIAEKREMLAEKPGEKIAWLADVYSELRSLGIFPHIEISFLGDTYLSDMIDYPPGIAKYVSGVLFGDAVAANSTGGPHVERLGINPDKSTEDYWVTDTGAMIAKDVDLGRIGDSVILDSGAVLIGKDLVIGDGVTVNTGAVVDNAVVERFAEITEGSYIVGGVVGQEATLKASFSEGSTHGENSEFMQSVALSDPDKIESWELSPDMPLVAKGHKTATGAKSQTERTILYNFSQGAHAVIKGVEGYASFAGQGSIADVVPGEGRVAAKVANAKLQLARIGQDSYVANVLADGRVRPIEVTDFWSAYGLDIGSRPELPNTHVEYVEGFHMPATTYIRGEGGKLVERVWNIPHIFLRGTMSAALEFSGTLHPEKEVITGISGKEESGHGILAFSPYGVMGDQVKVVGALDTWKRKGIRTFTDVARKRDRTFVGAFSYVEYDESQNGMVWGRIGRFSKRTGLSPSTESIAWVLDNAPEAILDMVAMGMEKLRPKEKSNYDGQYSGPADMRRGSYVEAEIESEIIDLEDELEALKDKTDKKSKARREAIKKGLPKLRKHLNSDAWRIVDRRFTSWKRLADRWVNTAGNFVGAAPEKWVTLDDMLAQKRQKAFPVQEWEPVFDMADWTWFTGRQAGIYKGVEQEGEVSPNAVVDETAFVHPSAIIERGVVIKEGAFIGPDTVIKRNAKVGRNTVLTGGATIEEEAEVGDDCMLWSAYVSSGSKIGNGVRLRMVMVGDFEDSQCSVIGDNVSLTMCRVFKGSNIGEGTVGFNARVRGSVVGPENELYSFARVYDDPKTGERTVTGRKCNIGNMLIACKWCDNTRSDHIGTVARYEVTKPVVITVGGKDFSIPVITNHGTHTQVSGTQDMPVKVSGSFLAGLSELSAGTVAEQSFVLNDTETGEVVPALTFSTGAGETQNLLGGIFERPGDGNSYALRFLLSYGMKAVKGRDDLKPAIGYLVEQLAIKQLSSLSAKLGKAGKTAHSTVLSQIQDLLDSLADDQDNTDGPTPPELRGQLKNKVGAALEAIGAASRTTESNDAKVILDGLARLVRNLDGRWRARYDEDSGALRFTEGLWIYHKEDINTDTGRWKAGQYEWVSNEALQQMGQKFAPETNDNAANIAADDMGISVDAARDVLEKLDEIEASSSGTIPDAPKRDLDALALEALAELTRGPVVSDARPPALELGRLMDECAGIVNKILGDRSHGDLIPKVSKTPAVVITNELLKAGILPLMPAMLETKKELNRAIRIFVQVADDIEKELVEQFDEEAPAKLEPFNYDIGLALNELAEYDVTIFGTADNSEWQDDERFSLRLHSLLITLGAAHPEEFGEINKYVDAIVTML